MKAKLFTTGLALMLAGTLCAQSGYRKALYGFLHPQDSTRTKVWWFHGQTLTTREGITADLEAFKQAGVGGVVYYDQVHGTPTGAIPGFSPEWWKMLVFAAQEAQRLGLTFESNISNGYVAGGRWITPELAMQQLAWTERVCEGGRQVRATIPVPKPKLGYHGDIAVLALPYSEPLMGEAAFPKIPQLAQGENRDIILDAGRNFTARSLRYHMRARGKAKTSAMNVPCEPGPVYQGTGYVELPMMGELQASADGLHYEKVCDLRPIYKDLGGSRQLTLSFPAVKARYFRLHLHDWWYGENDSQPLEIQDATLSARAQVDGVETKNGAYSDYLGNDRTPDYAPSEIVHGNDIINLTDRMRGDTLVWDNAPRGRWLVMRFYHQPTGAKSKHGREDLGGLECDKMSRRAVRFQWDSYAQRVIDSVRHHGAVISGIVMDSHEQGPQNWTEGFEKMFFQRNGYDLVAQLPVMAGLVVDSREHCDKVLRDVRHTIAETIETNYFGLINDLCRKNHVVLTAQAIGGAQSIVTDQVAIKRAVDKPQGEFWAHHPDGNYDIKDCSSAAHIYGKHIASGEAFTDARYDQPLSYIKQLADAAYGLGINEFVVCASAYQPWLDRRPGNTANGRQYCLNRNNTYWPMSRPFWDYQARAAFLLRQGKPVTDLALYLGDDEPVKIIANRLPDIPGGFDFDALSTDALATRLHAENGRLTLPDGSAYQALLIGRGALVTPEVRTRLDSLSRAGVKIWNANDGTTLSSFAKDNRLEPDILVPQGRKTYFAHRRTADADIYFIDNHEDSPVTFRYGFRTPHASAELWDAVTGRRLRLATTRDGHYARTTIALAPRQSVFVVLSPTHTDSLPTYRPEATPRRQLLAGPWMVNFDVKAGGPERAVFNTLTDWSQSPDTCIRYYSGTAAYHNTFKLQKKAQRCTLAFTRLCDAARVIVNGHEAGFVWCSPYRIDITPYVKRRRNNIVIEVANSLYNRMIGDCRLPEDRRFTWATTPLVNSTTPLRPSGIIGDVILESEP